MVVLNLAPANFVHCPQYLCWKGQWATFPCAYFPCHSGFIIFLTSSCDWEIMPLNLSWGENALITTLINYWRIISSLWYMETPKLLESEVHSRCSVSHPSCPRTSLLTEAYVAAQTSFLQCWETHSQISALLGRVCEQSGSRRTRRISHCDPLFPSPLLLYSVYTSESSAITHGCVHTRICCQIYRRAQLGLGLLPQETKSLCKK